MLGGLLGGEGAAEALAGAGQDGPCRDVADAHCGRQLEPSQVMELREQEGRALPLGNLRERPLERAGEAQLHREVLGGRGRAARLPGPRHEPDDLPATDLVERDAMGDLIQPGPRVLRLLERVVVAVGLDERVLGQVRGELGVTDPPEQVDVDLAVMLGEERLDEARGVILVPGLAHGAGHRSGSPAEPHEAAEDGWIAGHVRSGWTGRRQRDGGRALVGPLTMGFAPV